MTNQINISIVCERLKASLSDEQLDKLYQKLGFYLQDVKTRAEDNDDEQKQS